jgi:hypothetical protein
MKTNSLLTLVAAFGVLSLTAFAQDAGGPPQGGPGGQGGQGMGGRRPMPLIIGALDANHDGVIDADEIANASAALKKLDKNGDGKLTRDEFLGKPPGRPPMGGQGGPDGQGGPQNDGPQGPPPGQN